VLARPARTLDESVVWGRTPPLCDRFILRSAPTLFEICFVSYVSPHPAPLQSL
jgi:hypothetical protein